MKIYIATSWKLEKIAKMLAEKLREAGHEVDCFCDPSTGRFVFSWDEIPDVKENPQAYDAIDMMKDPRTQRAFKEDKGFIDWAEAVVMILPCGRSAHLEAGYAKGCGKKLFIWGEFPKGQWEVMYGFADGMFPFDETQGLLDALKLAELQGVCY